MRIATSGRLLVAVDECENRRPRHHGGARGEPPTQRTERRRRRLRQPCDEPFRLTLPCHRLSRVRVLGAALPYLSESVAIFVKGLRAANCSWLLDRRRRVAPPASPPVPGEPPPPGERRRPGVIAHSRPVFHPIPAGTHVQDRPLAEPSGRGERQHPRCAVAQVVVLAAS